MATRVQVEPCTTQDWELLEVHADVLEGGGLLKQLSLVYRDQLVALTVNDSRNVKDHIHIMVKEISTAVEESRSIWPESSDDSPPFTSTREVAMLSNSTEIVITPKPRKNTLGPQSWSTPLQVVPGALDFRQQTSTNRHNNILSGLRQLPTVPPGCVLVHPDSSLVNSIPTETHWMQMKASTTSSTEGVIRLVRIVFSSDIPLRSAGTFWPSLT